MRWVTSGWRIGSNSRGRILALLTGFLVICDRSYGGTLQESLPEAFTAWQTIARKVKSLNCEWVEQMSRPDGWWRNAGVDEKTMKFANNAKLAGAHVKYKIRYSLTMDGTKVRIQREPLKNGSGETFEQGNELEAYNGQDAKTLRGPIPNVAEFYGGIIEKSPDRFLRNRSIVPILLWCRSSDQSIAPLHILTQDVKIDKNVVLEGYQFTVVSFHGTSPGSRWSLWLNPSKSYTVARIMMEQTREGYVAVDIKIEYQAREDTAWVPKSWTSQMATKAGPISYCKSEMVKCEINPPVASNAFEIEFPVGTMISDERGSGAKTFIKQASGTLKELTPDEIISAHSHEDFMKSAPVNNSERNAWRGVFFWSNVALVVLIILLIGVRKRFARVH